MARRTWIHLALLAASLTWLSATGCATTHRTANATPDKPHDLLFGPEWVGLATRDVERSEWPVTTVFPDTAEHITYRERLVDTQGQSIGGRDHFYRRFTSVRTGDRRR